MSDLLSGLNPLQQEIVKDTDGHILTLAGAGSGKTRVLTHRIAYLIENGVRPWQILSVTFTNKAAREMANRLEVIIGESARDIWIGTFHGICNRFLRRFGEQIGLAKNFTILDEKDRLKLVKQVCETCNISYEPEVVISAIGNAKNAMLSPQDLQMNISNSYDRDMANAYVEYERKKDELSYIDFDDMIYKTVRLLRSSTEARELYQKQFKYVLADEGQDTNDAQYALLDLLTAEHNNLFVVADVDQSIYRWRGAKVQNMIQFQSSYPNSKIYKLEQNYRSTANIVNAANAVILNNEERLEKTAWTDNPPGDPIILFSAENDDNEAQFVSEAIHRIVEVQSRPYTDFAILYRTGRQSRMIELALTKIGIPYQVVGGKSFYDRKEIKDLVGYLRIVANPHDSLAYERVINVPKRGIGDTTVKKIDQYAKECFIPFSRGLEHIADVPKISKGTQAKILAFNELITLIREESFREGITILEILQNIMRRTDFMSQFDPEKEDDESRIENIKELLRVASDWDESNTNDKDLIDFLSETTLVTDTEDSETQEKVSLMTTHSSKGLEYPCVFIVGMEEGIFPHGRSLGNPQELEEERRLAYVAMTRAERKLFITHCKNRYEYNDPRPRRNRPSRFISEIPEELIKRIG